MTTPTIVITRPIDDDNSAVNDKSSYITDFSRRIAIENLFNPKNEVLPAKVPKIFGQVVFEKVKLKRETTEEEKAEKGPEGEDVVDVVKVVKVVDDVVDVDDVVVVENTVPKLNRNVRQTILKEDPDKIEKVSQVAEEVKSSNW